MTVRTCVICGNKFEKVDLKRYVWDGERPSLDIKQVALGRGAYCCDSETCQSLFMKYRKKWARFFRL